MHLLTNRLAGGVTTSMGFTKNRETDSKSTSIGAGPVIRYFIPAGEKLVFFPEMSYSIDRQKIEGRLLDPVSGNTQPFEWTVKGGTYSLGFGGAYFLSGNVALEGILSYRKSNSTSKTQGYQSDQENSRIGFNVGFQIYLQCQK
jgi:hypothetical protein